MRSRLHLAARDGEIIKVKEILKTNKELLNNRDHNGDTPLHCAAFHGHLEIVKLFLAEENIEFDVQNNNKMTPLLEASRCERWDSFNDGYGHPDIVRLLLAKGANPKQKEMHGYTALHIFAYGYGVREKIDINKLGKSLLRNSDINDKDYTGETPLHKASGYFAETKIAKLLLDHGADYKILNDKNKSPFDLAKDYKRHEIVKLISQRNKYPIFFQRVPSKIVQNAYEKHGYQTKSILKK